MKKEKKITQTELAKKVDGVILDNIENLAWEIKTLFEDSGMDLFDKILRKKISGKRELTIGVRKSLLPSEHLVCRVGLEDLASIATAFLGRL